jgi:hypothetical protein
MFLSTNFPSLLSTSQVIWHVKHLFRPLADKEMRADIPVKVLSIGAIGWRLLSMDIPRKEPGWVSPPSFQRWIVEVYGFRVAEATVVWPGTWNILEDEGDFSLVSEHMLMLWVHVIYLLSDISASRDKALPQWFWYVIVHYHEWNNTACTRFMNQGRQIRDSLGNSCCICIYRKKSKVGRAIGSFPNFMRPICFWRRTPFEAGCVLDAHVGEPGDHLSSVADLRYVSSKLTVLEEPTHLWMS